MTRSRPSMQKSISKSGMDTRSGLRKRSRSEEHTSELQSRPHLVCRLLLEKKKITKREDRGYLPRPTVLYLIRYETSHTKLSAMRIIDEEDIYNMYHAIEQLYNSPLVQVII